MHFSTTLIASMAALLPFANAVGHAIVKNNCAAPVYIWSVGSSVGPKQTIAAGKSYSEVLRHDPVSGGIAIKITRTANGLYDGSPQTNFAYTLDGSQVWYDLSDVFGDPFSGKGLSVDPSVTTCPDICWPKGVSPSGSQTHDCTSTSDVTLTLCATKC
ncbi:hypothetical protein N7456_002745 [Penicillium angulare]|uniref:BYS1 domain protein n=1 Tax=Penicillium angulare TaxID=116970 RepID=A0A9W9KQJ5_9EURO|nr:hypothetical protein N7456_002745 [Penicillium angulare]